MSKHLAIVARKNFLLRGKNLEQCQAQGGQPSAMTGWVERERERERDRKRERDRQTDRERQTDRDAATAIISIIIMEI